MKLTLKQKQLVKEYVKKLIKEAPDLDSMSSGFLKNPGARAAVDAAKGGEIIHTKKGNFKATKSIKSTELKPGDIFMGSYNQVNQGANIYEFLGITDDSTKYGEQFEKNGKIAFKTVKECLKYYKVSSLKALEDLQDKNEYGYHSYMCVKDLIDGDEGAWFYLFRGRWSRGSGAEPLSFTLLQKI